MAKFTKRHYGDVARILKDYSPPSWGYVSDTAQAKYDTASDIMYDFSLLFKEDNPSFDAGLFQKACGF